MKYGIQIIWGGTAFFHSFNLSLQSGVGGGWEDWEREIRVGVGFVLLMCLFRLCNANYNDGFFKLRVK